MNVAVKQNIRHQIQFLEANAHRLVIDADTHLTDIENLSTPLRERYENTPAYYHGRPTGAEELLREMRLAGVDMSLIWQNPAATTYSDDTEANFEALLNANRHIFEVAQQYPEKFIPAGWTDPRALGPQRAAELVDICIYEFGFPIVKLNPAQNAFPIDSEPSVALLNQIVRAGAVPAFHFGSDTPYTPPQGLANIARLHPEHPLLAVHMAGGGAGYVEAESNYQESRQLGLDQHNIRFILSAKRDTHIESDFIAYQLAGAPFCHHLFCASDAPYGRQSWNFGGYRLMLEGFLHPDEHPDERLRKNHKLFDKQSVKNYLGGNFARFIIESYERLNF